MVTKYDRDEIMSSLRTWNETYKKCTKKGICYSVFSPLVSFLKKQKSIGYYIFNSKSTSYFLIE